MSEFDWVKARSQCTASEVFKELAEAVQKDFASCRQLHPGPAQSCEFEECSADRFYVGRRHSHRVVYELTDSKITIGRWSCMGEHTPLMALTVRLDDDRKCILTDEQEKRRKPWQVRRKALEETLFG